jgi:hypothetical protein
MAFGKHRKICFDYEPGHKYPYVCSAWCEVGGMNIGDRFTEEVAEILIESCREDGITVEVEEVATNKGDA